MKTQFLKIYFDIKSEHTMDHFIGLAEALNLEMETEEDRASQLQEIQKILSEVTDNLADLESMIENLND